jgi:hypothetical protein
LLCEITDICNIEIHFTFLLTPDEGAGTRSTAVVLFVTETVFAGVTAVEGMVFF